MLSSLQTLRPVPPSKPSMAKMKSLTRVLFKRKSIDEANRFYTMYPGIPWAQAHITEMEDDDDGDTRSIESFSTTATVDDNPGTGRVLDTYFFQPAGRRIERLAMRFTIRHLHPSRIEAFIAPDGRGFFPIQYTTVPRNTSSTSAYINFPQLVLATEIIPGELH